MDPSHGDQPDRLDGDQEEALYTDAQGMICCSLHYDGWEGIVWSGDDGVDRGCNMVYRDVTRLVPVPDVPWLLMELVSHEVQHRSWVCAIKLPGTKNKPIQEPIQDIPNMKKEHT